MHVDPILPLIVALTLAAVIVGIISKRLRQPHVVGYLLLGMLFGPHGLSLVTDPALVSHLGSLGVVLLLFFRADALNAPYRMFDFTPVGGVVAIVGVAFVTLVGWRLLPAERAKRDARQEFRELEGYIVELGLKEDSSAIGKPLRELALELRDGYNRYIKQFGELENVERTLVARSEDFNRLIDEHLLWIRSAPSLSPATLVGTSAGLGLFISASRWPALLRDLWGSLPQVPLAWIAGIAALALVVAARGRAAEELQRTAAGIGNVNTDSFSLTARALLATIVIAAVRPLFAVLVGWPLWSAMAGDPFSRAVGGGLLVVALIGFGIALLNGLCRQGGVGDAHFGWPLAARRELIANLRWLAYFALPLGFVIWTIETYDDEAIRASLGRVAFVLAMIVLAIFILRVLRPHGVLLNAVANRRTHGFVARLRYLWSSVFAVLPLSRASARCVVETSRRGA